MVKSLYRLAIFSKTNIISLQKKQKNTFKFKRNVLRYENIKTKLKITPNDLKIIHNHSIIVLKILIMTLFRVLTVL